MDDNSIAIPNEEIELTELGNKNISKIECIHSKRENLINQIVYRVKNDETSTTIPQFSIDQSNQSTKCSSIIDSWKCTWQFNKIMDRRASKFNYSINNYSDLVTLNNNMMQLIPEYRDLWDAKVIIEAGKTMKKNLQAISFCLNEIEKLFEPLQSQLPQYMNKINSINNEFKLLSDNGVFFNLITLNSVLSLSSIEKLSEWSKRKTWNLVYDAKKHGFTPKDFYEHCSGKAPTITIIKAQETGLVFGGFTSVPWQSSGGYKTDETAFLFSQNHDCSSIRKFEIAQSQYAVYHHGESIRFGGGNDISCNVTTKAGTCRAHSYKAIDGGEYTHTTLAGVDNWTASEVIVYQVE